MRRNFDDVQTLANLIFSDYFLNDRRDVDSSRRNSKNRFKESTNKLEWYQKNQNGTE